MISAKQVGKFISTVANAGFAGGAKVANKIVNSGKLSPENVNKVKSSIGKFGRNVGKKAYKVGGWALQDAAETGEGAYNIGKKIWSGMNGIELKRLNAFRDARAAKEFYKQYPNGKWHGKFDGHKYLNMVKRADDNLLGYRFTGLGTAAVIAGAGVIGAGDAFKEFNNGRRGQSYGTVKNAPSLPMSTMGNSYANNAGATGDLVFALHNQRHSGIL